MASLRAKSMNWSMIAFMSSMSATIPFCVAASTRPSSISASRRSRASGVRRSCEIPARNVVRSRSSFLRLSFIRLKAAATARTSEGPDSGTGAGSPPLPRSSAARASRARGRFRRQAMRAVATMAIATPASIQ